MSTTIATTSAGLLKPLRKQYSSCDQCRHSRKACDGWIRPLADSARENSSCTTCMKKGRRCTFKWASELREQKKTGKIRQHRKAHGVQRVPAAAIVRHDNSACSSDSPSTHITSGPFPGLDSSLANVVSNPYSGWDDSEVERCRPGPSSAPIIPVHDTAASSSSGHLDALPYNQWCMQTGYTTPVETFGTAANWHASVQAKPYASHTSQALPPTCSFTAPFRDNSNETSNLLMPSFPSVAVNDRLNRRQTSLGMSERLFSIYQNSIEGGLCKNSPYNGLLKGNATKFYQSVRQMDHAMQKLRLRSWVQLSPSQERTASQVWQKALLAFACQMSRPTQGQRRRERVNFSEATYLDEGISTDLELVMQRTLWNDAQAAIEAAQGIASFHLTFARCLLLCSQNPIINTEAQDVVASSASRSNGTAADGIHHPGTPVADIRPTGSTFEDPAPRILVCDHTFEHMYHVKEQCLKWRRGLYWEARDLRVNDAYHAELLESFLHNFNIFWWLIIICDTTAATMYGTVCAIPDSESAIEVRVAAPKSELHHITEEQTAPLNSNELDHTSHVRREMVPLQNDYLLYQALAQGPAPWTWPVSEAEMERSFLPTLSVKSLLYHRMTEVQRLMNEGASPVRMENAIQNTLSPYWHWESNLGHFMKNCADHFAELSPKYQSWYALSCMHWNYGILVLAERIDWIDEHFLADEQAQMARCATAMTKTIALENAFAIAKVAMVSNNSDGLVGSAEEGVRPLMTDPWAEMMVRTLSKAATTLIKALAVIRGPGTEDDEQSRMSQEQLSQGARECVEALYDISCRSKGAAAVARCLEAELVRWTPPNKTPDYTDWTQHGEAAKVASGHEDYDFCLTSPTYLPGLETAYIPSQSGY